jgi:hypothetical protein
MTILFLVSFLLWKRIINEYSIGCSLKCILKVAVEESIVNVPRITDHGSALQISSFTLEKLVLKLAQLLKSNLTFFVVSVFTLQTDK